LWKGIANYATFSLDLAHFGASAASYFPLKQWDGYSSETLNPSLVLLAPIVFPTYSIGDGRHNKTIKTFLE